MSLTKRYLRRLVKLLFAVLLGALIGVNGVAFMQVWAITHFAESGKRTARPERLSVFDKITILLSGVNIPRPQNRRTPADLVLLMRHITSLVQTLRRWRRGTYLERRRCR